jgi:hypothetical protein
MNNSLILAEILFMLAMTSTLVMYFLMFLEMVNHVGVFHGAKAVIVAASSAILLKAIPLILILTGYASTDVEPIRSFLIPDAFWAPIIVMEAIFVLILIVVTMPLSPDEDELIYEKALDLLAELMRKIKEEKSEVIDSEENIGKPTAVNNKT